MDKFKIDYSKKQVLQLSNDAFYYLYCGEEPLDDDNIEEALEIQAMFPNGFEIEDNWSAVENSDLIEAMFVPYVENIIDYDEYENLTKYAQIQIKWLEASKVRVWVSNSEKGTRELRGDCDILVNAFGLKYFELIDKSNRKSIFYLKHFMKA